MCGAKEELRPYGPGGANVCYDCMMKNEDYAKELVLRRIDLRQGG